MVFPMLALAVAITSCKSDDELTAEPHSELLNVEKAITMTASQTEYAINVKADCHWIVNVEKAPDSTLTEWADLTVQPLSGDGNGTIVVLTSQNTSTRERAALLTLTTAGGLREIVNVRQTLGGGAINVHTRSMNFLAEPTESQTFTISSNDKWQILGLDACNWLHLSKLNGNSGINNITVTADEIQDDVERNITITAALVSGEGSQDILITQNGKAFINLSVDPAEVQPFPGYGGEREFTVKCNAAWRIYLPEASRQWLHIEPEQGVGDGTFRIFCEPNESEIERPTVVIVTAGTRNPQQVNLFINQYSRDQGQEPGPDVTPDNGDNPNPRLSPTKHNDKDE